MAFLKRFAFLRRSSLNLAWIAIAVIEPSWARCDPQFDSQVTEASNQAVTTPAPPSSAAKPKGSESKPKDSAAKPEDSDMEKQPLPAVVIEVDGSADWAKVGVSPLVNDGWTAVKVDDRLDPGTQIRTGLRSHVNLKFGETTVVSLRSATFASLDQLYRSANVENVRIGLGYGTVRGGSSEGEFRADVIVDSPIATLAKRGTEGWQLEVEPGTGRFRVSLAEYGLVEAIQKLGQDRSRSRLVRPGEYANRANIANMWIKQNIFDHNVTFYQSESITEADAEFTLTNTKGFDVLAPGGGSSLLDVSGRVSADFVLNQIESNFPAGTPPPTTAVGQPEPITRPEGNFGTGLTFRAMVPEGSPRSSAKTPSAYRPRVSVQKR